MCSLYQIEVLAFVLTVIPPVLRIPIFYVGHCICYISSSSLLLLCITIICRSLGVHISFVRSIAMDSWTPAQMTIMKLGGNQQCQSYLSSHGILPSTPIKAKYESDVAQLYKEILKARAEGTCPYLLLNTIFLHERISIICCIGYCNCAPHIHGPSLLSNIQGRPEPTELTKRAPASGNARPMSSISSMGGGGFGGGGGSAKGAEDPNGMERLTGESDEMYIARQTRLRNEAKARMAAKFGGGGMGGVGSNGGGGSRMGGIGSDPNYNPHSGYGGGGGASDFDVSALSSTVMSGLGSAFGALSTVATTVTSAVTDESTKRQLADVSTSMVSTAGSFWGGLSAGASKLINNVTQPDDPGSDGLADLQRQFHSQRSVNPNSKYSGFGSDGMMGGSGSGAANNYGGGGGGGWGSMGSTAATPYSSTTNTMNSVSSSTLREAMAGPGEDPNGIERLSGESDEQYVMRQTRLRDEAKARMAAKFGGGGMGGVGSGSSGMGSSGGGGYGGGGMQSAPTSSGAPAFAMPRPAAPSSGNATKLKVTSGDDFFANFGS